MDDIHDNVIIKRDKNREERHSEDTAGNGGSGGVNYNPRNAKAMSILMVFFSVFLLLSLVSYTPKDFIHTRLSFEEFFGLFTGSDIVKAKVDATQNWLGLIGAITSDFAYNSLLGYSILAMPFLIFIIAVELFRRNCVSGETKRKAWAVVIIMALISSSVAAFSSLSWTAELGREWYGAVGRMFAGLFSMLLGAFGAMLLFVAGAVFVLIRMTNVKVDLVFERAFNKGEDNIRRWKSSLFGRKEKPESEKSGDETGANRVSVFKKIISALKPPPRQDNRQKTEKKTEPVARQNSKSDTIKEYGNELKPIREGHIHEEPARIIKGSIDIKVNNPINKVNPVMNYSPEKEESRGNSLVEKLIEENKEASKQQVPISEQPIPEQESLVGALALDDTRPPEDTTNFEVQQNDGKTEADTEISAIGRASCRERV